MSHVCSAQQREEEPTRSRGAASSYVENRETFRPSKRRAPRMSAGTSILPLCLGILLSATSCTGWHASLGAAVVSYRYGRTSLLQLHASSTQRDAGGSDGPMRRGRPPRSRATGGKQPTPGRRAGRGARSPGVNAAGAVLEGEQLSLTADDYPGRTLDHVPGTWKRRPNKGLREGGSILDVTRNVLPRNGARLHGGSVLPDRRSRASEAMEVVHRIAEQVEKGSNLQKTHAARLEFQERSAQMAMELLELDLPAECVEDNCDVDDDVENDTSYIPFRGGWAETFPSMVSPEGKPDGAKSNIRIPFLFGTRRGCRASMAILAPPEATSLYQRIPFLTGSRRLPGGMGEDSTTLMEEEEAVALAKAKTEAAVRSLQRQREQKGEEEAGKERDEERPGSLRGTAGVLAAKQAADGARERGERGGAGKVAPGKEAARLDERSICKDMQLREGGRRVVKTGGLDRASFVLWSDHYDAGESEWTVRIDKQTGVIFVGCMVEPYAPQSGFARNLATPAWMIGSYGYVCRTGPNGQMSLTDHAKEQIGDPTVGALAFASGSMIRMRLDRDQGLLEFQVDGKPAFKLGGVDARARPFLNIAFEGDAASLLHGDQSDSVPASAQESFGGEVQAAAALTQEELLRLRAEADDFWN